jgi:hypothetical protein
MSDKPNTSLNERAKHSSSILTVFVSVPSMSNMTRCIGKRPNETDDQLRRPRAHVVASKTL